MALREMPDTEVIGMVGKTRDRIVVESERVGQRAREGDVLEVIEASDGTRYRVIWDDGHESTFRPAAGSARVIPAPRQVGSQARNRRPRSRRSKIGLVERVGASPQ